VHRKVVEFVQPAVKAYQQHRWANGQLTFSDLLVAARNLLRDNPAVRERFQATYRHVLVDEFQDTDPLQAEVLFYLTGENTHQRDWRRCDPRPGSLFIVGDDKQSIYGFRQADMAVFNEVAGLIGNQKNDDHKYGETADLVTNFRSAKRICKWCDDAFGHIFENDRAQAPDSQAEYVGFNAQRKVPASWSAVCQVTVPKKYQSYPGPIARHNAGQIAQYIRSAIARDEPLLTSDEGEVLIYGTPGDFMILTRNTKRLSIYAEALAEHGIPYTVAGGKDAGVSEELQGLVDLLACVLRPDDPVARVAYLRGPLVGFSDDALYRVKKAYESAEPSRNAFSDASLAVLEPVASELGTDLADRLEIAYALLTEARHLLTTEQPAVAIHQIAEQAGLFARALHHEGEASLRAGRLYRLLDEVRYLDGQGMHWSEILDELEDVLHGERELDGMTLETGQRDSVRLLNVHKAKGLQANVVFLADPYDRYYDPSPTAYVHQSQSGKHLVQPVCDHNTNIKYAPAGWDQRFEAMAEHDDYAEEHRLQYVAATRAKRLLVVSCYAGNEDKGFWADLYPFLDAADAPELTPPSDASATPSEAPPVSWQPDLSAAGARRDQAIDAGSQPRYREERVTEAIGVKAPMDENGGHGKYFGTAVHELFEMVNDARDSALATPDVIGRVLQRRTEAAPAERVQRVRQMIEAWTHSDLWNLLRAAPEVYTEIPIATFTGGEEAVLQRGAIDLVFRGPDGWVIVDFKTNRIDGDDDLQQHLSHYGPQLRAYTATWAGQTGSRVQAAGLWFTDTGGTWAPIDPASTPS
jgi:ATP-dependent helicase/nuclease subunit A